MRNRILLILLFAYSSSYAQFSDKEELPVRKQYLASLNNMNGRWEVAETVSFNGITLMNYDTLFAHQGTEKKLGMEYYNAIVFTSSPEKNSPAFSSAWNGKYLVVYRFLNERGTNRKMAVCMGYYSNKPYAILVFLDDAIEKGEISINHLKNREVAKIKEPVKDSTTEDKYSKLAKIKKLLDDGILTQEEFQKEKEKILAEGD